MRRLSTLIATAALALVVAACGGDESSTARLASVQTGSTAVGDGFDAPKSGGIELASTPAFCAAAEQLIGAMETVGVADLERPAEVRLAYTSTRDGLDDVADLAPNAGVATRIAEARALFLPLVDLLQGAGWDLAAVDREQAAELAVLSESTGPELAAITDEFEAYVEAECGIDVVAARAAGIDRFSAALTGSAGQTDGRDGEIDLALLDEVPAGERGGEVFCLADRFWNRAIAAVDGTVDAAGSDDAFLSALLASADVYTSWGERIPPELAVASLDMNVAYAEVVATYGETQDVAATRIAYRTWRSGADLRAARAEIDGWIATSC